MIHNCISEKKLISEDVNEISHRLKIFRNKIENKSFLVTGGAGFLGSWFCEVALNMGAKVFCIDNFIASNEDNIRELELNDKFQFIEGDISQMKLSFKKVDYIINMASIASPPLYQAHPLETLNSASLGSINLFEFAKRIGVKKYLLTSTSEVYGNPRNEDIPTSEDFPGIVNSYGPRSMYDEAKRIQEAYAYSYQKYCPIRIARIFNTYGPKIDLKNPSQYGRALIKFIYQALNNEIITVYGDGSNTRSFCYINDQIVGLFQLLLSPGIDGEVMNIGNTQEISILELAKKIKEISKSESKIKTNSSPTYNLQHDPTRRCPDISKAIKLIKFSPKFNLENGLERTIEYVKLHISLD